MSGPDGAAAPELVVLTEAGYAAMLDEEGAGVVERNGRYWAVSRGFCQPIHWLARFRFDEIGRPTRGCWGYRAALAAEDAHLANGSVPLHVLENAQEFTEHRLARLRRRDLREARRHVEYRRLRDPSLLIEQGWAVFSSAQARAPYGRPLTRETYQLRVEERASDPRRVFVAGLIDGTLAGYMEAHAVDGVLYAHEVFVATEHAPTGIGTGLYVETMQIGVRAGTIREICYGLHLPERPGIRAFKDSLGCTLVQIPARVSIPRLIGSYLKTRRPVAYYRLTGEVQVAGSTDAAPR